MRVRFTFYGGLQRLVDARQLELEFSENNLQIDNLPALLVAQFPNLKEHINSIVFSVGDSVVNGSHEVHDGDEVGLLPPVSGG